VTIAEVRQVASHWAVRATCTACGWHGTLFDTRNADAQAAAATERDTHECDERMEQW
jgi:hypothetical protein